MEWHLTTQMFHYCAYEIAYILYSLGHIHPIIKEQTLKIVFHFFYAVNKINIAFKTNEAIYFPKLMHQRRREVCYKAADFSRNKRPKTSVRINIRVHKPLWGVFLTGLLKSSVWGCLKKAAKRGKSEAVSFTVFLNFLIWANFTTGISISFSSTGNLAEDEIVAGTAVFSPVPIKLAQANGIKRWQPNNC